MTFYGPLSRIRAALLGVIIRNGYRTKRGGCLRVLKLESLLRFGGAQEALAIAPECSGESSAGCLQRVFDLEFLYDE